MTEELLEKQGGSEGLDSPGKVFSKHRLGLVIFILLAVLLIAVFVLYATGVINLFITNCILIPVTLSVILYFAIRAGR